MLTKIVLENGLFVAMGVCRLTVCLSVSVRNASTRGHLGAYYIRLRQGWQKTRKFEKARKSPGFFKKPGLFPGLFQIEYDRNSTSIVSIK